MSDDSPDPHNRSIRSPVAVLGVGLIGGSIAAAVRKRFPDVEVIGFGRTRSRLEAARDAGILTRVATDPGELSDARFVVACTPTTRLADDLLAVLSHLSDDAILTDAGSVKGPLCEAMRRESRFVGAHPLAGSEKTGWEHAEADLYDGKTCVVTPLDTCEPNAVQEVVAFWSALGMHVVSMSPSAHDAAVAQTSHLPHIAAAAVARLLQPEHESLVATGFRDTTRVASGDAAMWTAILEANAEAVSAELSRVMADLSALQHAVDHSDPAAIERWFAEAAEIRSRLTFE